jgi:acetolactate synthase-1/3 small subunit
MKHTVIAWMEDKPGVLNRVSSLFRRRNFNIESLAVGHSETPGISRMTFVVDADEREMRQVQTQLYKLINVTAVQDVTHAPTVERELALIKVHTASAQRADVLQLVEIYRASVVDVALDSLVIQVVGSEERVESLINLLASFGITEMVRSGRLAMVRGNGGPGDQAQDGVAQA